MNNISNKSTYVEHGQRLAKGTKEEHVFSIWTYVFIGREQEGSAEESARLLDEVKDGERSGEFVVDEGLQVLGHEEEVEEEQDGDEEGDDGGDEDEVEVGQVVLLLLLRHHSRG